MTALPANFVESRSLGLIESRSEDEIMRAAWRDWRQSPDLNTMKRYEDHAILADGFSIDGRPPILRQVGADFPAVQFFGQEWRRAVNAGTLPKLPDDEFDSFVSQDYFAACDGEPTFSQISYTFARKGQWINVIYDRFLGPIDLDGLDMRVIISICNLRKWTLIGTLH